jgi:hypothetical protein
MDRRTPTATLAPIIPHAGQRIGSVAGPGQSPKDNAGTVLCQFTDRWGTYALVLMDDVTTRTCRGMNRGPGIGWHDLK